MLKVLILGLFSSTGLAQDPLVIENLAGIEFGTVTAGTTVTVAPGDNPSSDGAQFRVSGERRAAYIIILPTQAQMNHTVFGETHYIPINSFTSNPAEGANGQLTNNGRQNLYVGATAIVPYSIPAGTYAGSFTVEVVYP